MCMCARGNGARRAPPLTRREGAGCPLASHISYHMYVCVVSPPFLCPPPQSFFCLLLHGRLFVCRGGWPRRFVGMNGGGAGQRGWDGLEWNATKRTLLWAFFCGRDFFFHRCEPVHPSRVLPYPGKSLLCGRGVSKGARKPEQQKQLPAFAFFFSFSGE